MSFTLKKFMLRQLKKMTFLPSKIYVRFLYEYFTGKKLNLMNPVEFNEKIQWYKVFYRKKTLTQLSDKYEVRSFIEEKIGVNYLNELYGVYDNPYDIPFDSLPEKFVIKATHASGYNLIVKNKAELNIPRAKNKFKKWLSINQYYRTGQEWAYKNITPRLVVEAYIEEEGRSAPSDYKFYCFNGKAKFIKLHIDRLSTHREGFYDLNFEPCPFTKVKDLEPPSEQEMLEKPDNLKDMIAIAETLASDFPFVRVDLYSVQNRIIFGEMTFYPSDGRKDFYPDKYNKVIGDYFVLPKIPANQKCIT